MAPVSNGRITWPLMTFPPRGPMHHWHTVGLDIPRQVARLQSLTPLLQAVLILPGQMTRHQPEGNEGKVRHDPRQDRERDSGCIPGSDMAQCDAAGVNGSNRILSHGAPLSRMMPNGCLGSPAIVLLLVLTEASSWVSDRREQHHPPASQAEY